MTHAQKISNSLKVFLRDFYTKSNDMYVVLRTYTYVEDCSFDTQYYFNSFYLSFSFYKGEMYSMVLYPNRYSTSCELISFESSGEICIGKAIDDLFIYKDSDPTVQHLEYIGLDLESLQYLKEIHTLVEPLILDLARELKMI